MTVQRYELIFPDGDDAGEDIVVVTRTELTGPGGHPVYQDPTGIVRAEIAVIGDRPEVRMLASGGHQSPAAGVQARPLPD
ncbi:DUF6296 family protein [Streptomyces sp. NRRL S-87]|uniref:DUF6296 family protein n=1 Tax=Streptomyces sp. NRRL S-87 TaxID=1463920 RepID=UPI0004BF2046|nr:DUF6296 family protein [Streptomyces sp. NRRL S-87]